MILDPTSRSYRSTNSTGPTQAFHMPLLRPLHFVRFSRFHRHCRHFSTPSSATQAHPRLEKLNARLPRFLHRYTTPLLTAPITHISSFLLLHEITAVVPLFALAGFFHYSQWMPPFISEGKYVADGVQMFGNWFRRRGWLGEVPAVGEDGKEGKAGRRGVWWNRGEGSVRIVVEYAQLSNNLRSLRDVNG